MDWCGGARRGSGGGGGGVGMTEDRGGEDGGEWEGSERDGDMLLSVWCMDEGDVRRGGEGKWCGGVVSCR